MQTAFKVYKFNTDAQAAKGYRVCLKGEHDIPFVDLVANLYPGHHEGKQKEANLENIFYTYGRCLSGPDAPLKNVRAFVDCEIIPFDIDNVSIEGVVPEQINDLIELVHVALGTGKNDAIVVWSGHGLQLLFKNSIPFKGKDISRFKEQYMAHVNRISAAIEESEWYGKVEAGDDRPLIKVDGSVFRNSGLLRMPGTLNHKRYPREVNKPPLPLSYYEPCETKILHLPKQWNTTTLINPEKPISTEVEPFTNEQLKAANPSYPDPHPEAILADDGCQYLKDLRDRPEEIEYDDCYRGLAGIIGYLPNGANIAREYAQEAVNQESDHETVRLYTNLSYVQREIDKFKGGSRGPTTCERIQQKYPEATGPCHDCKHRGKVKSPLMIRDPDRLKEELKAREAGTGDEGKDERYIKDLIYWKEKGFTFDPERDLKEGVDPKGKKIKRYPERLQHYFAHEQRYVIHNSEQMMVYDAGIYRPVKKLWVKSQVQALYDPTVTKPSERDAATDLLYMYNHVDEDFFEHREPGILAFSDHSLKVEGDTFTPIPHSPDHRLTNRLEWTWVQNQTAPIYNRWIQFALPDPEDRFLVESFFGYALSGDPYIHNVFLILQGTISSNGKSTLLNLLSDIAGAKISGSLSLAQLLHGKYSLAGLHNKLVNIGPDEPKPVFDDDSRLKALTGNDWITAEGKFKEDFQFRNRAKIIIPSNPIPDIQAISSAIKRRMRSAEFPNSFDDNNTHKISNPVDTMMKEASAIFGLWARAYTEAQRIAKGGDVFPNTGNSLRMFEEARKTSNPLFEFMEDEIIVTKDPNHHVPLASLWEVFNNEHQGVYRIRNHFKKDLVHYFSTTTKGVKYDRPNGNVNPRPWGFTGIVMRSTVGNNRLTDVSAAQRGPAI